MALENEASNLTRARSITVGNAFGGTTEVSMRGNGDRFLWVVMQPVEVLELINQLAANIGCHINVKPRDDFGSWRQWREVSGQPALATWPEWSNHPPNATIPAPEQQPGLNIQKEPNYEPTMATQKTVNRRNVKRAAKTA
jgi:hypothetical protein